MLSLLLLTLFSGSAEAKKKPKGPPPPPPQGWYKEEGWSGECFAPFDWETLGLAERRMKRQEALEAMREQWTGKKDAAVSFEEGMVENLETVLLGRPEKIEAVTAQNRELCVAFRANGNADAWQSAIRALPAKLTAGECLTPMIYTKFEFLDIGRTWQGATPVCKGDKVKIFATVKDKYRVSDKGAWINVTGDGTQAAGAYPCTAEGCTVGMLLLKFAPENGGPEEIMPLGVEKIFVAPQHGTLTYSINDNVWYDNRYYKGGNIEDRTAVTYQPAEN